MGSEGLAGLDYRSLKSQHAGSSGVVAILAARYLLSTFVSLYPMADASLLGVSLLQAITFQGWHQLSSSSRA